MRAQNLKHIKQIKESLRFLNSTFPSAFKAPKFRAYLPPNTEGEYCSWHIVTDDWLLYSGQSEETEEFKLCKKAIRSKFKSVNIIFCFQHFVTTNINKNKGYIILG